jgi:hypothetical protein
MLQTAYNQQRTTDSLHMNKVNVNYTVLKAPHINHVQHIQNELVYTSHHRTGIWCWATRFQKEQGLLFRVS